MPRALSPALVSKFDNRIPFLVDGTIHTVDTVTRSRQTPLRRGVRRRSTYATRAAASWRLRVTEGCFEVGCSSLGTFSNVIRIQELP
jgi:hypothetical protein